MTDTTAIVAAAMRVRGEAPAAWETFVMAVREYAALTAMEMVKCPPDQLPRAQGMAQMANELTQTLMNAPKLYERMQQARKQ